jgi:hypothetical protein
MDDREANIDILFRNGLKDYEVLPPPEVWKNIAPKAKNSQRPILILRSAAMVAVLLSLTFLAYRWSIQFTSGLEGNAITMNPESESPVPDRPGIFTITEKPVRADNIMLSDASVIVPQNQEPVVPETINILQQEVDHPDVADRIPVKYNYSGTSSKLVAVNNNKSVAIDKYVPEYFSEETPVNGSRRWTIAALVSPTYYTSFNSGSNEAATQLMSGEQPLISYAGGLALSYKINRRLSVQSGLYYSSFGNELSGITSFGGFQQYDNTKGDHNFEVLTMNGTVYTSNADVFLLDNLSSQRVVSRISNDVFDPAKANLQYLDNSLRQNFSYLELPFVLKYKVVDRAIDFNIIGGLSSNILVTNSVYANLGGTKYPVGKTEGLNMITFSSSLGMGMEYSLTNNLSLNLEPTFRYYLNSFSEIPGMRVHPYSFGLFSGVSYKF